MPSLVLPYDTINRQRARCAGDSAYPQLWNGLVGLWDGDYNQGRNDRLWDLSGKLRNGTLTNGPVWKSVRSRRAVQFVGGSDDLIDCGTFSVVSSQMTIACWLYMLSYTHGRDDRWVSKADGTAAANHDWMIGKNSTSPGVQHIRCRWNRTSATLIDSTVTLLTGEWFLAASTFNNGTGKLFYNGREVASSSSFNTGNLPNNTDAVYIGNQPTATTNAPDGLIGPVMLWSRVLSQPEIMSLYLGAHPLIPREQRRFFVGGGAAVSNISGVADIGLNSVSTLSGTGALSGAGEHQLSAPSSLAGTGALATAFSTHISSASTVTGSGALSGAGDVHAGGNATLEGSGACSGSGEAQVSGTGVLAGTGTLTGTSSVQINSIATLAGSGALSGASQVGLIGALSTATLSQIAGTFAVWFGGFISRDLFRHFPLRGAIMGFLQEALAELEFDVGCPVVHIGGYDYPCVISSIRRGTELEVGGFIRSVQFTVFVRRNALSLAPTVDSTLILVDSEMFSADSNRNSAGAALATPAAGKRSTVQGKEYRVLAVSEAPGGSHWELSLGNVDA